MNDNIQKFEQEFEQEKIEGFEVEEKEEFKPFATVKLSQLEKVVEVAKLHSRDIDSDISMEYLIGSCFPTLMKKFQAKMESEYQRGFMDGIREMEYEYRRQDNNEN